MELSNNKLCSVDKFRRIYTVTIELHREWTQTRKALGVSALTIECEICWLLVTGNHIPMHNPHVSYSQRLAF